MEKLFATFLYGPQAAGLLILRFALATGIVLDAVVGVQEQSTWQIFSALIQLPIGALLLMGFWTPIAAVAACLLEFELMFLSDAIVEASLQRVVMCLCLGLLGPGAWSIDARLFGRKRVTIRPPYHKDSRGGQD